MSTLKTPYALKPLPVILGPTAVGKTVVAIDLAQRLNGEVVSADSRYFYRGMDIGTAKPTPVEMQGVPHHLVDVADPDEVWSLAAFREQAALSIDAILGRARLPLLVGGAGQYIRAVVEGWTPPEVLANPGLRQVLEDWAHVVGAQGLHERLAQLDPPAAEKIDYHNVRRSVRALEVIFTTGRRFSEQRRAAASPYRALQIGLTRPRPELYARIDARIDLMLEQGLVAETQRLLEAGFSRRLPALSAIGYREIAAYLEGEISLGEAVTLMRRNTRTYVRRQNTWFKPTDPLIHWFPMHAGVVDDIEATIRAWLARPPAPPPGAQT